MFERRAEYIKKLNRENFCFLLRTTKTKYSFSHFTCTYMQSQTLSEPRQRKTEELKRMKRYATGLLLLMMVIFVLAKHFEVTYTWLKAIRAFAEAAMVGALADWFAVTALFRHPLGLPIPHTNLIANNQQAIGDNLGSFVTNNFLADDVIAKKIAEIQVSIHVAAWLREDKNSTFVVNEAVRLVPEILNGLDETQINAQLQNKAVRLAREIDMGDVASDALQFFTQQGHHQLMLEKGIEMLQQYLQKPENRNWIKEKFTEPSRFLSFVDSFLERIDVLPIADRILDAASNFLEEIEQDKNHRLRGEYSRLTDELIYNLKHSDEYKQRIEILQQNVLQSDTFAEYTDNLWTTFRNELLKNLSTENSKIKQQMKLGLTNLGEKIAENPELQQQIDDWIKKELLKLLHENRNWISSHISQVVKGWNKDQVADILEVEVGRDLQFIRINGTLVGGTVGLLLYLIFDVLFKGV